MTHTQYYVDLNPDYPSRYARRWMVWYKFDKTSTPRRVDQFVTRKAADRCAAKWNDVVKDC